MALTLKRTLVKSADLGGNNLGDIPFEEAFSNIAHAFMSEKCPRLLDYEVGFQLIRRDPDRNRAAAVVAFKAGPLWLLVPAFFVDGKLLCSSVYVKNQNRYVPLKENWINFLLSKKPVDSGDQAGRSLKALGVRQPDMGQILRSPHKYASDKSASLVMRNPWRYAHTPPPANLGDAVTWTAAERDELAKSAAEISRRAALSDATDLREFNRMDGWAKVACAAIARSWATLPEFAPILPSVIRKGGVDVLHKLAAWADRYPVLQRGLAATYGADGIAKAASEIEERPARVRIDLARVNKAARAGDLGDPVAAGRLEIIRGDVSTKVARLLDDAERTRLLVDGYLIKDAREDDEVSVAYPMPLQLDKGVTLTSPSETGIYDVLTREGEYARCLVVVKPHGVGGRSENCVVVELGKRRAPTFIHPSRVLLGTQYRGWKEWFEGLPEASDLSASSSLRMLVGPSGDCSLPFRVRRSAGTRDNSKGYDVEFETGWGSTTEPLYGPRRPRQDNHAGWGGCNRIWLKDGASRFRGEPGELFAPATARLLTLRKGYDEAADGDDEDDAYDGPLMLGTPSDINAAIMAKTKPMTVTVKESCVDVNGRSFATALDAKLHLVGAHGFREDAADIILEVADATCKRGASLDLRVKRAFGFDGEQPHGPSLGAGPTAPAFPDDSLVSNSYMGNSGASQVPFTRATRVQDLLNVPPGLDGYRGNDPYNPVPDPQLIGMAQQASQQGQREVIDASVVGSLLRATSDSKLIDEHIEPLMEALDSLAKLDIAGAWHPERLEDRYGKANAQDIKEAITNNLDTLGDLVLELRLKTIEADPAAAAMDNDIEAAANQ